MTTATATSTADFTLLGYYDPRADKIDFRRALGKKSASSRKFWLNRIWEKAPRDSSVWVNLPDGTRNNSGIKRLNRDTWVIARQDSTFDLLTESQIRRRESQGYTFPIFDPRMPNRRLRPVS